MMACTSPLFTVEVEAVEDLLAVDLDVQVLDFKHGIPFQFVRASPSVSVFQRRNSLIAADLHRLRRGLAPAGPRPVIRTVTEQLGHDRWRVRAPPIRGGERSPHVGDVDVGCVHHPDGPSRLIEISFCASTANSIGSCCSTSLTKPLTTSATASSSDRPRWRQ